MIVVKIKLSLSTLCHQAAIEEGDEDSVSREQSAIHRDAPEGAEDDLDDLPWHHAQLAMMYGRQVADDIVHPQMEPKKVDLNPNMMLPEGRRQEIVHTLDRCTKFGFKL